MSKMSLIKQSLVFQLGHHIPALTHCLYLQWCRLNVISSLGCTGILLLLLCFLLLLLYFVPEVGSSLESPG